MQNGKDTREMEKAKEYKDLSYGGYLAFGIVGLVCGTYTVQAF